MTELKSVKTGEIKIGNIKLIVHILSDGRRIIEEQSFIDFCTALSEGTLELNDEVAKEIGEFIHMGKLKNGG